MQKPFCKGLKENIFHSESDTNSIAFFIEYRLRLVIFSKIKKYRICAIVQNVEAFYFYIIKEKDVYNNRKEEIMKKEKESIHGLDKLPNGLSSVSPKTIVEVNQGECQNCKNCSCQSQKILENIHTNIKDNLKK